MSISTKELALTVAELTAPGKGILAADESGSTIEKRLKAVNVASTEEARRSYRELLFSTPGLGDFISGVILFEETLKQKSAAGVPLPEVLNAQGIVPGIKVDKGTVLLPEFPGETLTQGLDGLAQRLNEYKQLDARFAKWRASACALLAIACGVGMPAPTLITARHLAKRAPNCLYSPSRCARPSKPCVTVSPGNSGSSTVPLSTLMPGTMPCAFNTSGKGTPAALFCLSVSSNRMTPLIKSPRPGAENNSSR